MERFITGKSGSIHVDGKTIDVTDWSLTDESDWQETTHSGSEGFYTDIPGTMKASGSFTASYNMDDSPIPALAAGAIVSLTLDYETNVPAMNLPKAGIDSFEVTSEAKGVINFTCNFHSIGVYTWA